MQKVLIVDDEYNAVEMLKKLINWPSLGMEIVGTAHNGKEGYDKYKKLMPHLIITDLKMPIWDGLTLIQKIRVDNPSVPIIIMSAYDDFKFAKKAMKYGCQDYLLKPIDEKELIQTLTNLHGSNLNSKQLLRYHYLLKAYMQTNRWLPELEELVTLAPFNFSNYYLLSIDLQADNMNQYNQLQHDSHINMVQDIINHCADSYGYHILLHMEEFFWIVLISDTSPEDVIQLSNDIHKELTYAKHLQNISAKVCFSHSISSINDLHLAFIQNDHLRRYCFYINDDHDMIYGYNYNCSNEEFNKIWFIETQKKIMEAISSGHHTTAKNYLEDMFITSEKITPSSLEAVYELCFEVISALKNIYDDNPAKDYHHIYALSYVDIQSYQHLTDLKEFMFTTIDQVMNTTCTSTKLYSPKVREAISIIDGQFQENLSLNLLCQEIAVSKNYFCYLFKREVGQTITSYITNKRLEKAKSLMVSKHLKTYEIADMVGYENASYFSKMFKKQYGMSPNDYRMQQQNES